MEFQIGKNKKTFFRFNWQFQKELHNKIGKPNQKCGCVWECGKLFDYEIDDNFSKIFKIDEVIFDGDIDGEELKIDKSNFNFKGKLPCNLVDFIKTNKISKNANANIELKFNIDEIKLFEHFYNNTTLDLYFKDTTNIEKLLELPPGNIDYNIKFSDPSMFALALPLLPTLTPGDDGLSFILPKKSGSIIKNKDLLSIIDTTMTIIPDLKRNYKIIYNNKIWKYKIDVQNYLWLSGNCKYNEEDDFGEWELTNYAGIKISNLDITKLDKLKFKFNSNKRWIYNIIKNEDVAGHNPDPYKCCYETKDVNGKSFLLDEELPGKADQILGRKN